jgi:hypothetical protein
VPIRHSCGTGPPPPTELTPTEPAVGVAGRARAVAGGQRTEPVGARHLAGSGRTPAVERCVPVGRHPGDHVLKARVPQHLAQPRVGAGGVETVLPQPHLDHRLGVAQRGPVAELGSGAEDGGDRLVERIETEGDPLSPLAHHDDLRRLEPSADVGDGRRAAADQLQAPLQLVAGAAQLGRHKRCGVIELAEHADRIRDLLPGGCRVAERGGEPLGDKRQRGTDLVEG